MKNKYTKSSPRKTHEASNFQNINNFRSLKSFIRDFRYNELCVFSI